MCDRMKERKKMYLREREKERKRKRERDVKMLPRQLKDKSSFIVGLENLPNDRELN